MTALMNKNTLDRLLREQRSHPERWASQLVFLLGPWFCLWAVETLNGNNIFTDLYPWQVFMNLIWYYALFLVLRLILGANRRAAAAGAVLTFVFGLLNHYVLRFRGRIIFPADITGWRTAANVAEGFDYGMDEKMVEAGIILIAYLFLVAVCVPQKGRAKLPLTLCAAVWVAVGGYSYAFFGTDMLPNLGIYTQQWVTQQNGFLLNFTIAIRYSSIDKPEDYSEERVLELMKQYPALPGDKDKQPTNIVVIMNESLGDFEIFERFESSEDPMPYLHSMEENTVKGWMYSTVTGGGTATVEFEYLTGFTSLFQPPHTVAYQLYVEEGMPSLAALADSQGYSTTAFHPYKSSGWNRVLAYDYLDFEEQLYEEDVEDPHMIRQYISDLSDYKTIFETTEEEETSFFFNVTMQNHSGYSQGWKNLKRTIDLPKELSDADRTAEQYFALAQESDEALQVLLDYYANCGEPTLVVMFGDHQPPLKNEFYEVLYGKKMSERTTQEVMQQYAVPFFVWANYDIEERQDVVISPNYLGVLTAQVAGLPMTGFMNFQSQMYEHLPAITPVGMVNGEGEFLTEGELDEEERRWLEHYEILNYCGVMDLFDEARPMFCVD